MFTDADKAAAEAEKKAAEDAAAAAATAAASACPTGGKEHVQRILLAINNFTRKVSEMLDSGRAMFKDLAADFEDRLCTIHKERVEKWEEEIPELRALHNAQLQLFHIRQ